MRLMEDICGTKKPYLTTQRLEDEHARCRDKAIYKFQNKRKMGGESFSQTYTKKLCQVRDCWNYTYLYLLYIIIIINALLLLQDMDKAFVHFKAQNESKNVFKSTRTAGVYCAIVAIMYFLSSIFGFTGLYLLANICNFIMCICILTLMLLAYIRYIYIEIF